MERTERRKEVEVPDEIAPVVRVVVVFEKSKSGGIVAWINGKASFPDRLQGQSANTGEIWEVIICTQNPAKTVYFLLLVRKIRDHDRRSKRGAEHRSGNQNDSRKHDREKDGRRRHQGNRTGTS